MLKRTMRDFDTSALTQMEPFDAYRVAGLRNRDGADEYEFANRLGITVRLLRRWEAGASVPFGASLKALNLVRVHGLQHLA